jgi:hypothetical protein
MFLPLNVKCLKWVEYRIHRDHNDTGDSCVHCLIDFNFFKSSPSNVCYPFCAESCRLATFSCDSSVTGLLQCASQQLVQTEFHSLANRKHTASPEVAMLAGDTARERVYCWFHSLANRKHTASPEVAMLAGDTARERVYCWCGNLLPTWATIDKCLASEQTLKF